MRPLLPLLAFSVLLASPSRAQDDGDRNGWGVTGPFRPQFGGALEQLGSQAGNAAVVPAGPVAGRPVSAAPPRVRLSQVDAAIAKGARYLQAGQLKDGSWGVGSQAHSEGWNNGYIRVAITAYALKALRAARAGEAESLRRARRFIDDSSMMTEAQATKAGSVMGSNNDRPYSLALGLQDALSRADGAQAARTHVQSIDDAYVTDKMGYMRTGGGRTYGTFQLAMVVDALLDARDRGHRLPGGLLEDMLDQLQSARQADGSYAYETGMTGDMQDAAARTPAVVYVLHRAGRADRAALTGAVRNFLANRAALQRQLGTKILTHDKDNHQWAKYYYLYGVYWTARGVKALGGIDAPEQGHELAASVLALQKTDGSWVDSAQASGPYYGTAMGILALDALKEAFMSELAQLPLTGG